MHVGGRNFGGADDDAIFQLRWRRSRGVASTRIRWPTPSSSESNTDLSEVVADHLPTSAAPRPAPAHASALPMARRPPWCGWVAAPMARGQVCGELQVIAGNRHQAPA